MRWDEMTAELTHLLRDHAPSVLEHSQRMSHVAGVLAWQYSLDSAMLRQAALLHDIGKTQVSYSLLEKPEKLSPDEELLMDMHARIGAQILKDHGFRTHPYAMPVAGGHHEQGSGRYRFGSRSATSLAVHQERAIISAEAQRAVELIAVIDVADSLLHPRAYKPGLPFEIALELASHEFHDRPASRFIEPVFEYHAAERGKRSA